MRSIRMFTLVLVFLSLGLGNVFAITDTLSCQAMFSLKQDFEALVENNQMVIHLTDYSFSTEEINSWNWNFGDGTTSTEQNPSHTYSNAGAYVVTLEITTNQYTSRNDRYFTLLDLETYSKKKEEPDCHAAFDYFYDASEDEDSTSATVIFTDASYSKSTITNWLWNFGDETTSTEQNPTHTYLQNGKYEVLLIVYSENGSDTTSGNININVPETPIEPVACEAAFDYSILADSSNGSLVIDYYTITFHDMSSSPNEITGWLWEFGDGSTSTEQVPEHTYAAEGEYEVKLTIYSEDCESSVINPMMIYEDSWNNNEEVPTCQASFAYGVNIDSIYMEPVVIDLKTISFFDNSTSQSEITNWLWDFGDGNTSTEQNPIHTFSSEGYYEVELTIYSNDCESSTMNFIIIDESQWDNNEEPAACHAEFVYRNKIDTIDMESTVDYKTIYFSDISTSPDKITSWLWDFGDGSTSTIQNPMHTYSEEGEYVVSLSTYSNGCEDYITKELIITNDNNFEKSLTKSTGITLTKNSIDQLKIYPNPASSTTNLGFYSKTNTNASIAVYNLAGKLALTQEIAVKNGQNNINLDISTLEKGIYIMRINNSTESINFIIR